MCQQAQPVRCRDPAACLGQTRGDPGVRRIRRVRRRLNHIHPVVDLFSCDSSDSQSRGASWDSLSRPFDGGNPARAAPVGRWRGALVGPFPAAPGPNPPCQLSRQRALQWLLRGRVCRLPVVDAVVAGWANNQSLASHPGHQLRPHWLRPSRCCEVGELGYLVYLYLGSLLTQFASAFA
jgi:hypothetical protein